MLVDGLLPSEEIVTTRESGIRPSTVLLPHEKWESWEMSDYNPQPKKFSAPNS